MTFYLVGPSGAGKSTLGHFLATEGVIEFVDSDRVLGDGTGQWERVLLTLDEWEARDEVLPLVVAIGAGTQDIDRNVKNRPLRTWLADRSDRVVAIMCTPEETLARRSRFHASLESVQDVEFAAERVRVYEVANESINTSGLDGSEAAVQLMRALNLEAAAQPRDGSPSQESLPV